MKKTKSPLASVEFVAAIGTLAMFCFFPFFLPTGYIKMTIAKMQTFCVIAVAFFFACIAGYLSTKKDLTIKDFLRNDKRDYAFLAFFIFGLISCIASPYGSDAFTGKEGRYMGFGVLICLYLTYLWVSRFFKPTDIILFYIGLSFAVMNIIAFLQYIGFDPFHLFRGLSEASKYNFVSLLGNQNVFSAYVCLETPFVATYAILGNKKQRMIAAGVFFTCILGVLSSGSDSSYLGTIPALIIILITVCNDKQRFNSFLHLLSIFSFALVFVALVKMLPVTIGKKPSFISETLTDLKICLPLLAFFVVFKLVSNFIPYGKLFFKIKTIGLVSVTAVVIIGLVVAVVYFTEVNTTAEIGKLSKYLRFNEKWGTYRGYVWTKLFGCFSKSNLFRKFFGYGEDCVYQILTQFYGKKVHQTYNMTFDSAHNEIIQYLVTQGIAGLGSYLAVIGFSVQAAANKGNILKYAACFAVLSYVMQSVVNIYQPMTIPLLFVFIAFMCTRDEDESILESPAERKAKKAGKKAKAR